MTGYVMMAVVFAVLAFCVILAVLVTHAENREKLNKQKKIERKKQMERWLDARPKDADRIEGYDHLARALAVGVITSEEHDAMMERIAKAVINQDIQEIIEDVEIVERPELE